MNFKSIKKELNKIIYKIKNPNYKWLIVYYLSLNIIILLNVFVFGYNKAFPILQYILWFISIFSLVYFIYLIIYFYPKIKKIFLRFMSKHKLTNIFATSYKVRTFVYSFFSVLINLGYVFFEIYLFYINKITWFISLAIYHLALGIAKAIIIIKEYNKKIRNKYDIDEIQIRQVKVFRNIGIFLIILDILFALSVTNLLTVKEKFINYHYLIIIFALYFIYKLGLSIYNFFKAKKYDSYSTQAIRNINLVTTLFSLFAFQTTLFSILPLRNYTNIFNLISSLTIWVIILILSIKMIVKANDKIKKLK